MKIVLYITTLFSTVIDNINDNNSNSDSVLPVDVNDYLYDNNVRTNEKEQENSKFLYSRILGDETNERTDKECTNDSLVTTDEVNKHPCCFVAHTLPDDTTLMHNKQFMEVRTNDNYLLASDSESDEKLNSVYDMETIDGSNKRMHDNTWDNNENKKERMMSHQEIYLPMKKLQQLRIS